MVLTFIFRERHLPLFKVPTHLTIMTHLQNQVHIVAVLKIVVQLKEIYMKYVLIFVGKVRTILVHPTFLIHVKIKHTEQ